MTSKRPVGLGIDAGGTATRWHVADAQGGSLGEGVVAPMTGHVYGDEVRRMTLATLDALAEAARKGPAPTRILAGITGLDAGTAAADFYSAALAERFELPASAVVVENDMGLAYRAAFAPGQGILVYSGTGSVACHLTAAGEHIRAGGRGVIIDDGGSGFWIAKEAVKALFRVEDRHPGAGWSSRLGQALAAGFGGATWDDARAFIYGGDRGRIATLSTRVAEAAVAGDATALRIVTAAGEELADLARALIERLGPRDVALAGGASVLHPALWEAFRAGLPPTTVVRHERLDAARAGAVSAASGG